MGGEKNMRWTSRKLISMWAFTGLFTVMLSKAMITGDQFVSLLTILLLAYFGANVAEKFS